MCGNIARDPTIDGDRVQYAYYCFSNWLKNKKCSLQANCCIGNKKFKQNHLIENAIKKMEIRCNYFSKCSWIGNVSGLENHITDKHQEQIPKNKYEGFNARDLQNVIEQHKHACFKRYGNESHSSFMK